MDVLVKAGLKAILNNDAEGYERWLDRVKLRITSAQKWLQDIPLICTLCNNPEFIQKTDTEMKRYYSFKLPNSTLGDSVTVIDLARILNYQKCVESLQCLYGEAVKEIGWDLTVDDYKLCSGILKVGKLYDLNQQIIVQSLNRLVENGLCICARGPCRRTILHEAVLYLCSWEIFKALFLLGCDVNSTDCFGQTAFQHFICNVYNYKSRYAEIVNILKVFLYENPEPYLNTGIIQTAISYDRWRFPDEDDVSDTDIITDDCVFSDNIHNYEELRVRHEHPKEHLRLLPWLYTAGFPIPQQYRDGIELPSLFCQRVTYSFSLKHPRSLKEIARSVIRSDYPGRRLHNVVNGLTMPTSVRDYILIKDFISDC